MSETRWAVKWHSQNRLDGVTEYFMWDEGRPLLFLTRREAREYVRSKYGWLPR